MGNTLFFYRYVSAVMDHPHIHEEYSGITEEESQIKRITPTYMGNTNWSKIADQLLEDHPHIHGEYKNVVLCLTVVLGSPPHTWGILIAFNDFIALIRITPTYMGNTKCSQRAKKQFRDHPHIHGEYRYCSG